jgi:hypothetical protein
MDLHTHTHTQHSIERGTAPYGQRPQRQTPPKLPQTGRQTDRPRPTDRSIPTDQTNRPDQQTNTHRQTKRPTNQTRPQTESPEQKPKIHTTICRRCYSRRSSSPGRSSCTRSVLRHIHRQTDGPDILRDGPRQIVTRLLPRCSMSTI